MEFDPGSDTVTAYVERTQLFLEANEIAEAKHVAVFLSAIGKMYLIVIDAHSKWIEAFPMTSATALTTIQHLRVLFAQFGVPEVIVSDNGSQFVAAEFQSFCRMNGIRHIQIAPYHPSSNGLAERAVKVFKQGIRKLTEGTVNDRIAKIIVPVPDHTAYHNGSLASGNANGPKTSLEARSTQAECGTESRRKAETTTGRP